MNEFDRIKIMWVFLVAIELYLFWCYLLAIIQI